MIKNLFSSKYRFYIVVAGIMMVWMLFFDINDIISQFQLKEKRNELRKRKAFYEKKIIEVSAERESLFSNDDLLEGFARENYLMKKPDEEIFVIVEK